MRNNGEPDLEVEATILYGHIDDETNEVMGKVIFDLRFPPWRKWPNRPLQFKYANMEG
jgi:hypothetical protein